MVGNLIGVLHTPCTLKTTFVYFDKSLRIVAAIYHRIDCWYLRTSPYVSIETQMSLTLLFCPLVTHVCSHWPCCSVPQSLMSVVFMYYWICSSTECAWTICHSNICPSVTHVCSLYVIDPVVLSLSHSCLWSLTLLFCPSVTHICSHWPCCSVPRSLMYVVIDPVALSLSHSCL